MLTARPLSVCGQNSFFTGKPRSLAVDAAASSDAYEYEIDEDKIGAMRRMFLKLGGAHLTNSGSWFPCGPHAERCAVRRVTRVG